MKKWKKVVLWIVSILVVVAIGGAFAANYAIDKMLGSMSGLSAELLNNTDGKDTDPAGTQNTGNGSKDVNAGDTPGSNDSSSSDVNGEGGGSNGSVATNSDSNKDGSSDGYTASISTEKAKEIEENVTLSEKAKVLSILTKRLSASDLATLQSLASGGLSVEDKKKARALMLEKLTESEYNELIAIAAKHGVSQGKSYAEVSKK